MNYGNSQKSGQIFNAALFFIFFVHSFFWIVWWFTLGGYGKPWPIQCMTGWGIGLVFQYKAAYGGSTQDLADKEYKKLKREKTTTGFSYSLYPLPYNMVC